MKRCEAQNGRRVSKLSDGRRCVKRAPLLCADNVDPTPLGWFPFYKNTETKQVRCSLQSTSSKNTRLFTPVSGIKRVFKTELMLNWTNQPIFHYFFSSSTILDPVYSLEISKTSGAK